MTVSTKPPVGKLRPMTLTEKILCHQSVGLSKPEVRPGEVLVVKVARTLASELTLFGIKTCLEAIGGPRLWKRDRFFLACDHSVDPRNYEEEVIKKRLAMCKEFSDSNDLTDYFGPNQSILHTEFYRQKVEPGSVVVGADSHSCSHGCVGAYAMGMGAADVTMPLVTGMTWLKVPETVLVEFEGTLPWGMVGKDVMLWILRKFRRNTVGLDRCIEFGGDISQLDVDSRFAISNMATEFGALAGIFPGDELTQGFIEKRTNKKEGSEPATYFRADSDAEYVAKLKLDLSEVVPTVALYPSPDNVLSLDDPKLYEPVVDRGVVLTKSIRQLDGCFIGACTTTENEIILAGLLLEVAMDQDGAFPCSRVEKPYQRRVTPGSQIMIERLEKLGILDIYRRAGFVVGAAGCSYCLGVGADVAGEGEVWLSSQNRNFRNRMGKGSIGNVTSACVVAASSFNMEITDPRPFLAKIDHERYARLADIVKKPIMISEPCPSPADSTPALTVSDVERKELGPILAGRAQVFGDSIDTDAIIPAPFIPLRGAAQGEKSFAFFRPTFVQKVKEGANIVIAGNGFGCGSSREEAVSCLRFCGVQAVIAKSFSFIFGRNLLTLDLLGITIAGDEFFELAAEGTEVEIDMKKRVVRLPGASKKEFSFELPEVTEEIYKHGGVVSMYQKYGKLLFSELAQVSAGLKSCDTSCHKVPAGAGEW